MTAAERVLPENLKEAVRKYREEHQLPWKKIGNAMGYQGKGAAAAAQVWFLPTMNRPIGKTMATRLVMMATKYPLELPEWVISMAQDGVKFQAKRRHRSPARDYRRERHGVDEKRQPMPFTGVGLSAEELAAIKLLGTRFGYERVFELLLA